jgi:hypothetical protein
MPDKTPEAACARAKKWYSENRDRGLINAKRRYWINKDNPEFMAKRRKIVRESYQKYLIDNRINSLDHYYRNRERILRNHKRGFRFIDKYIPLDFDARHGICSQCGYQGFTAIHHIMYDPINPLAYTIELCVKCHKAEPNGPILKGVV